MHWCTLGASSDCPLGWVVLHLDSNHWTKENGYLHVTNLSSSSERLNLISFEKESNTQTEFAWNPFYSFGKCVIAFMSAESRKLLRLIDVKSQPPYS